MSIEKNPSFESIHRYHWNPIHYVHFPTNSLNEFSNILSYFFRLFSTLPCFASPLSRAHTQLHSTNICFVSWFQIVISTNANMISALNPVLECVYTVKSEAKWHWLFLPCHLKSKHFTQNLIEEANGGGKQKKMCTANNIRQQNCYETICLDWFYHLCCTYALLQPYAISLFLIGCRLSSGFLIRTVHVYIKTITDYIFRRSPHFLFRWLFVCACVYVCVCVLFCVNR